MGSVLTKAYVRPRAYVRVKGPDAADLLQRIVSNDILASPVCEALILTAKGRVIAPLLIWRRGEDDFLLLTEPELGERHLHNGAHGPPGENLSLEGETTRGSRPAG